MWLRLIGHTGHTGTTGSAMVALATTCMLDASAGDEQKTSAAQPVKQRAHDRQPATAVLARPGSANLAALPRTPPAAQQPRLQQQESPACIGCHLVQPGRSSKVQAPGSRAVPAHTPGVGAGPAELPLAVPVPVGALPQGQLGGQGDCQQGGVSTPLQVQNGACTTQGSCEGTQLPERLPGPDECTGLGLRACSLAGSLPARQGAFSAPSSTTTQQGSR